MLLDVGERRPDQLEVDAAGLDAKDAVGPGGTVIGVGMVLWGIERFLDEHLWLGEDGHLGSLLVQGAGIALGVGGVALVVTTRRRWGAWTRTGAPGGHLEAGAAPTPVEVTASTGLDEPGPDGVSSP